MLTPPTGIPELADLDGLVPAQRSPGDHRPSPPPAVVVDPCLCGHARAAHEHYRPGHDCGACGAAGCGDFRAVGGPLRRAARRLGLAH